MVVCAAGTTGCCSSARPRAVAPSRRSTWVLFTSGMNSGQRSKSVSTLHTSRGQRGIRLLAPPCRRPARSRSRRARRSGAARRRPRARPSPASEKSACRVRHRRAARDAGAGADGRRPPARARGIPHAAIQSSTGASMPAVYTLRERADGAQQRVHRPVAGAAPGELRHGLLEILAAFTERTGACASSCATRSGGSRPV